MNSVVDHLVRLGMSEYEARAYVATVSLGEGTVKEISTESGVPRSRAYDVMENLAKRGFVQVSNSNPICYRAIEPLAASNHLMQEIKNANDEIVKELTEIGSKAERGENPIWTLKGEFAINHKITELIDGARESIVFVFFNNRIIFRYAKLLNMRSLEVAMTAVIFNRPESFIGHLGKTRIMKINPSSPSAQEVGGELDEKGFVTKDGWYTSEMIMLVDGETTFLLSKEKEDHRGIVITGTIMSLFSHSLFEWIVTMSEEASKDGGTSE